MPIEQSSSLLEQQETRTQKPKGLLQRINDSKRKTLYALTLALGSLAGGTGTATAEDPQPHRSIVQTLDEDIETNEVAHDRRDEGLEYLVTDAAHKTFTCTYQGLSVSGHLNDQGEVIQITLENAQIDLTESVTTKSLEPFLYRALKSLDNIRAKLNIAGELHLTTLGGARFFFTIQRVSDRHEPLEAPPPGETSHPPTFSSLYIATANDVFLVDPEHEAKRQEEQKELPSITAQYNTANASLNTLRNERQNHLQKRYEKVWNSLRTHRDREYQWSERWWSWEKLCQQEEKEYKVIDERFKGKDGKSALPGDEYRPVQIDFENHIERWEKTLGIVVDAQEHATFEETYNTKVQERDALKNHTALTRILIDEQDGRHITEVTSLVTPKNFTRTWNTNDRTHYQKYEDNQCTAYHVHRGNVWDHQQKYWYHDEGPLRWLYEYAPDKDGALKFIRSTEYWINGNPAAMHNAQSGLAEYYTYSGRHIITEKSYKSESGREVLMEDDDGQTFGTYETEKKKNPKLTLNDYIDLLTHKLNTLEKLHCFLMTFMEYTSDNSDYWQTPEETIQRTKNGKMLGDCDDYAFLSREILRRQGKNAYVVYIPKHAICIWAEKDNHDHYNAWSICTYGLDTNGHRYGTRTGSTQIHGHTKLIDALNSLMKKYKYAGLGLSEGQDYTLNENAIWLCEILSSGARKYSSVDADHFLKPIQ